MIDYLSLYPVGSLVQLNNKKISLVIEAIPGSPLRPKVRSIRESTGADISELQETVDLSKDNTVYVTGLVYDDNYEVPEHKAASR
jgi:hypothetical protein